MGGRPHRRPRRLAEKLRQIRTGLGLTQEALVHRLELVDELDRAQVSDFERDRRVPSLPVLLAYARSAGVYMDALVDDELDLPDVLPCTPKHPGIKRRRKSKEDQIF